MTMIHITEERLLELVDMKADELFAAIEEIKADPIQKNWVYDAKETAALQRMLAEARAKGLEEAAGIAKAEGVSPETNVNQPEGSWYRHGQRIAAAILARAAEVREGGA